MATVVDSLVVTLGLDASKYKAGQQEVSKSLKKTRDEANTFAKDLEASGKQAAQLFAQVKTEALGLIGTLVGAGGIAAFVGNTTRSLADLGREARNIGVAVPQLAAFRNMVERNGGSAESATQSMKGFVDQVERFKVFGDPTVFKFLNPIGANIDETPIAVFMKFVRFVEQHKGDIPLVNLIGHGLGFDQGLINTAIQIGNAADAQRQLNDEMKRVPTPEMIENSTKLQQAWEDLSHQAIFTGETIQNRFSPALQSLLKSMTQLLADNPAVTDVLTGIAGALTAIAAIRITGGLLWFVGLRGASAALTAMVGALERMVPALALLGFTGLAGGEDPKFSQEKNDEYLRNNPPGSHPFSDWLRSILPGWLGGTAAPVAPRVPSLGPTFGPQITGGGAARSQQALAYFMSPDGGGYTRDQALGIIGWMGEETGGQLNPDAFNPDGGGQGAQGATQLRGPRIDRFRAMFGHDPRNGTFAEQLAYTKWELANTERATDAALRRTTTKEDAAREVTVRFGRGPHPDLETANAQRYAQRFSGVDPTSVSRPLLLHIDPSLTPQLGGSAPIAGATTNASTAVHIGSITVHSQATDAHGVAMNIRDATHDAFTQQANRGLQ